MDNGATDLLLGEIKGQLEIIVPIVTRTDQRVGGLEVAVAEIREQIKVRKRTPAVWLREFGLLIGGVLGGFFAGKQGG